MVEEEEKKEYMKYLKKLSELDLGKGAIKNKRDKLIASLEQIKLSLATVATRFETELDNLSEELNEGINKDIYEDLPIYHKLKSLIDSSDGFIIIKEQEIELLVEMVSEVLIFVNKYSDRIGKLEGAKTKISSLVLSSPNIDKLRRGTNNLLSKHKESIELCKYIKYLKEIRIKQLEEEKGGDEEVEKKTEE